MFQNANSIITDSGQSLQTVIDELSTGISGFADTDLSNLSEEGQAIIDAKANISSNILNITESTTIDSTFIDGMVLASSSSAINVTIPNDTVSAGTLINGSKIYITRVGTGAVNIVAGSGVTINAINNVLNIPNQHGSAMLIKTDNDTWEFFITSQVSEVVTDGAGVIEEPVITIADANNGIINIAGGTFALYDNVNKTDKPYTYSGGNQNLTLIDGSNYIYINYNSGAPIFGRTNDFTVINNSSIVLVGYIFKDGINVYPYKFYYKASASVKGITNNIQSRLYNTDKYRIESGLTLSTSGASILISSGDVWVGDKKISLDAYNSSVDSPYTYVWYFTNGAWTYLANVTSIFNSTYQGATSTVGLTNGKYAVNWIFRIIEKDIPNNTYLNKIFIFLGRGDYTKEQAEAESLYSLYNNAPIIPNYILERGILVGNITSLTNSSVGTVISKYNQNSAIDNTLKGDFNDVKNPLGVDLNNMYKELPLTDASSISWDLSISPRASINLTANRILANPTNAKNGTEYILSIKQGSTPYNLTFDTNYKWKDGIVPTLSTTNGAVDLLIFYYSQGFMLGTIKRYMTT